MGWNLQSCVQVSIAQGSFCCQETEPCKDIWLFLSENASPAWEITGLKHLESGGSYMGLGDQKRVKEAEKAVAASGSRGAEESLEVFERACKPQRGLFGGQK